MNKIDFENRKDIPQSWTIKTSQGCELIVIGIKKFCI